MPANPQLVPTPEQEEAARIEHNRWCTYLGGGENDPCPVDLDEGGCGYMPEDLEAVMGGGHA